MKITHVKVCNYRNLRNIDIGLAETVAIIGENNSGKSNFLKAITLPFLTDDNTHISKKLSWFDINNETKKCYYNKIIENQNKIKNDEITIEQFVELLPIVSVEVNIQASGAEEYYVKDLSYEIRDGKIQYGIKYEFAPKSCEDIFRMVKEIVSENEINDANLNEVKMNLLPVEYYNYSVKVSDGSNISYDTLKQFKYEALEAERDDFSRTKNQLGSKFLVDLLKDGLSDQDKLKIEKEYSHFFESLKKISDINDIINWQDTSELKEAKKFFSHINILPNMPPMQSILNSVRLGYSEEELSMQGLGHRNLVLLFVLINSLIGKNSDTALNVLTIEEPEAHLYDFVEDKHRGAQNPVEGLMYSDIDNIHAILLTREKTLPNISALMNTLMETDAKERVSKELLLEAIDDFEKDNIDSRECISEWKSKVAAETEMITKKAMKKILNMRTGIASKFNRFLHEKYGVWIDGELRKGEFEATYQIGNLLNIKYEYNEKDYLDGRTFVYYVGAKSKRLAYPNACCMRKVISLGEELEYEEALPLMAVEFVRNSQYTVLPFPFKYLREYIEQC